MGQKIDLYLLAVIELVYSASISSSAEKLNLLRQGLRKFDVLKFLVRIVWEIKALDNKKYLALSEPFDEIGRMLGGWVKKVAKETPPKNNGGEQR